MIHVIAFITAHAGKRADILAVLEKNLPLVRGEDGCVKYEVVVDVPEFGPVQMPIGPDEFVVIEEWTTADTLKAHAKSAHMVEFWRVCSTSLAKRVIHVLEGRQ